MKNRYLLILITTINVLVHACAKKEAVNPAKLQTDKTQLEFSEQVYLDSFVVTPTEKWKITKPANADWFMLNRDSGLAGTTVVWVRVFPNPLDSARATELTINSTGALLKPVAVKIVQEHSLKIEWPYPASGKGGETITINGSGFSATPSKNKVTINGLTALVETASNRMLHIKVPFKAGPGPLIVTVGNKSDTIDFRYNWVGLVTPFAGSVAGYSDGIGTAAKFYRPMGIAFDAADNLYVCDYANYKIRKITPSAVVTTLPGRFPPILFPSLPATDFNLPTGVAVKPDGTVYVVEYEANAITEISPTGVVRILAGNQYGLQNGIGSNTAFYWPTDVVLDAAGNLYVTDMNNYCIRKITPDSVVSTFVGGPGGYQDGAGLSARFNRPTSIAIDPLGNLYTTDVFNNRIRKIDVNRNVTTIAGTGSHEAYDGNALTTATFGAPNEIAIAPDGTLYIGSRYDNFIRLLRPTGIVESARSFINTVTGQPYQFSGINGLAVSKTGILHVADYYNNLICKVEFQ